MSGKLTHVWVRKGVAASMIAVLAFGSAPVLGAFAEPVFSADAGVPAAEAGETVLRVGATEDLEQGVYGSLASALKAATEGAVIVLDRDVEEDVTVGKNVVVDGQGKFTITGQTTLRMGTLQNLTLTTKTASLLSMGNASPDASITMKSVTVKYPVEDGKRGAGSVTLASGSNAQVLIDGCTFMNEAVNDSPIDAVQWSYGFFVNTLGKQGSLTFTNNSFEGAFRTMLVGMGGKVTIRNNTFTNKVYSVANGPTSGSGPEATCLTTAVDSDGKSELVIEGNVFDDAGAMFFQQSNGAVVNNNTIKEGKLPGHYIQVRGSAGSALDMRANTFAVGEIGVIAIDTVGAPLLLPPGVKAVSYWAWDETPEDIKPADYSSYAYSYDAAGHRVFHPSSEGALKAFLKPASGNIGAIEGDTIVLADDIAVDSWDQIWNVSGITIDGGGHTLKVNGIESLDNHNALIQSDGGNTIKNLAVDLTGLKDDSPFAYRAFDAANGDVFSGVTIKGNEALDYGITVDGTAAVDEAVTIDGCTFDGMGNAVYDSETGQVENLKITNSTITNCEYAVIMRSPSGVFSGNTVTGGKFNACASGITASGNTFKGKSRIKFYAAPKEFKKNSILEESYLAKDKDLASAVDISENYWGGGAPSATQVPEDMKASVTGADVWYKAPTMKPSDLNTYVPPVIPPSDKTEVEEHPDGSTTTTVTKPDGSQTVTHETATGTESVVKKDKDGNVTSTEVAVSKKDAESGRVELPIEGAKPAADADKAPEVEIDVPSSVSSGKPVQVTVPVAKEQGGEPDYGVVLYAVDAEGNETLLPKSYVDAEGNVVFDATGDVTIKIVDNARAMPDVTESDWFAGPVVDFATARGIVSGVPGAGGAMEFRGDAPASRAMVAAMLHNLELAPVASSPEGFDDVDASDWYAAAAAWGASEGIIEGHGDGSRFGGEEPVTREQLAVFLMRYAGWLGMDTSARAGLAFPDASSTSGWARDAMEWAVAEGLFTGYGTTGELRPGAGATRAQVAAVLMRFIACMYE